MEKKAVVQNLQLYNLVDKNISYHFVERLIDEFEDVVITYPIFEAYIENKGLIDKSILEKFKYLDRSYFSLYCLIYFNFNAFTIEKLSVYFKNLDEIRSNLQKLETIGLREDAIINIKKAITFIFEESAGSESLFGKQKSIQEDMVSYIQSEQPVSISSLKNYVFGKYPKINSDEYQDLVNEIVDSRLVYITFEGFKTKEASIEKYLTESGKNIDVVILRVINGEPLKSIVKNTKYSIQEMSKYVSKRIKSLPLFEGETLMQFALSTYDISETDATDLGFSLPMYRYVKIKHKNYSPSKDAIDYICDKNLLFKEGAKRIIDRYGLLLIDLELFNHVFEDIFYYYLDKNNINSFSLEDISSNYNKFLKSNNIKDEKLYIGDPRRKTERLKKDERFIFVKKFQFIVNREESYSFEFLFEVDQYIGSFVGIGSVEWFFKKYKPLCTQAGFDDVYKLFAFLSHKYVCDPNVEFLSQPFIKQKNCEPYKYLESLLLDLELPCTIDQYIGHVEDVTGIEKSYFLKNYRGIFEKYLNSNNMLSLKEDLSDAEITKLVEYLDNREAVGFKYLKNQFEILYKERADVCLNANILRKLGFNKTDTTIYHDIYPSRTNAVRAELEKQPIIIDRTSLYQISNLEFFFYRSCDAFDESLIVNIAKEKYLNLVKRNQTDLVCNLKKDLVNILKSNEHYVLTTFLESSEFESLLDINDEYKDLLYAFDTFTIVKDIIKTTRDLSTVDSNLGVVFCKGELSLKIIISKIVEEYNSLSILELQEILFDQYGIDKPIYNRELSDMGFYCPKTSEKVYLNIDYYNLEMGEILDGNT